MLESAGLPALSRWRLLHRCQGECCGGRHGRAYRRKGLGHQRANNPAFTVSPSFAFFVVVEGTSVLIDVVAEEAAPFPIDTAGVKKVVGMVMGVGPGAHLFDQPESFDLFLPRLNPCKHPQDACPALFDRRGHQQGVAVFEAATAVGSACRPTPTAALVVFVTLPVISEQATKAILVVVIVVAADGCRRWRCACQQPNAQRGVLLLGSL